MFLYKEDFEKFTENFHDAVDFIKKNSPTIEPVSIAATTAESSVSFEDLGK